MARTKTAPKSPLRSEVAASVKPLAKKKAVVKTPVAVSATLEPQEAATARKEILEMIKESKKTNQTAQKPPRRPVKAKTQTPSPVRMKTIVQAPPIQSAPTIPVASKPLAKATMKAAPKPVAPKVETPPMLPAQPAKAELMQPANNTSPSPETPKAQTSARRASTGRVIGLFGLALLVVIILALGTVALGLYRFKWNDTLTTSVAKTLMYPAAIVRTDWISYSQYSHDFDALKQYYTKQQSFTSSEVAMPTDDVIRGIIMDKLINDRVLKYEASQMGSSVTDEEVEKEIKAVIEDAGGEQELTSSLEDLYGWTIEDFKESILRPFLLREEVQEKLSADETLASNIDAKQRIAEVDALIKDGGQTFEDVAQQYSEDSTAEQGGDLGYMSRGDLVAEFADAAFALEAGQVSEVVRTKYGYHIIKVEEKVTNDGSQSPSLPEGEELIHARHILIRTANVDDWLSDKVDQTRIYRLLK